MESVWMILGHFILLSFTTGSRIQTTENPDFCNENLYQRRKLNNSCDFETGACGYTAPKHGFTWMLLGKPYGSGASVIHSAHGGEHYGCTNTVSEALHSGLKTTLATTEIPPGNICIEVWYTMPDKASNLAISLWTYKHRHNKFTTLWALNGNQGNTWKKIQLSVHSPEPFKIVFNTTRSSRSGVIGVDDVLIYKVKDIYLHTSTVWSGTDSHKTTTSLWNTTALFPATTETSTLFKTQITRRTNTIPTSIETGSASTEITSFSRKITLANRTKETVRKLAGSCNFEINFCNYTYSKILFPTWLRKSGIFRIGSSIIPGDRFSSRQGHYVALRTKGFASGDMISPVITTSYPMKMQLWYYLATHTSKFDIYKKVGRDLHKLWTSDGSGSNFTKWLTTSIEIEFQTQQYQIVFRGYQGGLVGIDDITIIKTPGRQKMSTRNINLPTTIFTIYSRSPSKNSTQIPHTTTTRIITSNNNTYSTSTILSQNKQTLTSSTTVPETKTKNIITDNEHPATMPLTTSTKKSTSPKSRTILLTKYKTTIATTTIPTTTTSITALPNTTIPATTIFTTTSQTTTLPASSLPPKTLPTTTIPTTKFSSTTLSTTTLHPTTLSKTKLPTTIVTKLTLPTSTLHKSTLPTTILPTTKLPTITLPTTILPTTKLPITSTLHKSTLPTTTLHITTFPTITHSTTKLPTTTLPSTSFPTTSLPNITPLTTITLPTSTFPSKTIPKTTFLTTFSNTTLSATTLPTTTLPSITIPKTTFLTTTFSNTTAPNITLPPTTLSLKTIPKTTFRVPASAKRIITLLQSASTPTITTSENILSSTKSITTTNLKNTSQIPTTTIPSSTISNRIGPSGKIRTTKETTKTIFTTTNPSTVKPSKHILATNASPSNTKTVGTVTVPEMKSSITPINKIPSANYESKMSVTTLSITSNTQVPSISTKTTETTNATLHTNVPITSNDATKTTINKNVITEFKNLTTVFSNRTTTFHSDTNHKESSQSTKNISNTTLSNRTNKPMLLTNIYTTSLNNSTILKSITYTKAKSTTSPSSPTDKTNTYKTSSNIFTKNETTLQFSTTIKPLKTKTASNSIKPTSEIATTSKKPSDTKIAHKTKTVLTRISSTTNDVSGTKYISTQSEASNTTLIASVSATACVVIIAIIIISVMFKRKGQRASATHEVFNNDIESKDLNNDSESKDLNLEPLQINTFHDEQNLKCFKTDISSC